MKKNSQINAFKYHFQDFVISHYRELIKLARKNWKFISFDQYKKKGRKILWRHDIDLSPHRAFKLALIEKKEGIVSTYFVHLHSIFYNLLEKEIVSIIKEIQKMGHDIGLHFDPDFYGSLNENKFIEFLSFEKNILEKLLGTKIRVFSLHNPGLMKELKIDNNEYCDMVNAYGKYLKENYMYFSDSNGYWQSKRLYNVLKEGAYENLHVLTHPAWWQDTVMSPKEKILRCISGHAQKTIKCYEEILKKSGRNNIDWE